MKFWEMLTICPVPRAAFEAILRYPEWEKYYKWYMEYDYHVDHQNRDVLDSIVPEELVHLALRQCNLRFRVHNEHLYLQSRPYEAPDELSACDAYDRYGSVALVETIEYGSYRLPEK